MAPNRVTSLPCRLSSSALGAATPTTLGAVRFMTWKALRGKLALRVQETGVRPVTLVEVRPPWMAVQEVGVAGVG